MYRALLISLCVLLGSAADALAAAVSIPPGLAAAPPKTEVGTGVCATAVHVDDSDAVTTLELAIAYLARQPGMNKVDGRISFSLPAVDLRNSDAGAGGDYSVDGPLPYSARPGAAAPGNGQSVAMRVRGYVNIARPGVYTFAVLADDGYSLTIATTPVLKSTVIGRSVRDSRQVSFAAAGLYPLELIYFQNDGAAMLELAKSNRDNVEVQAFPQSLGDTFKLVPTEELHSALAGTSNCTECNSSAECGAARYCRDGLCQDCVLTSHCGAACTPCASGTPVCFNGACVECSSTNTSACDARGFICDTNQCVPCLSDTQCGAGRICDTAFGQCIPRPDLAYGGGACSAAHSTGAGDLPCLGGALLLLGLLARRRRRPGAAEGGQRPFSAAPGGTRGGAASRRGSAALIVAALLLCAPAARAQDAAAAAPQAAFNAQTFRPAMGGIITVEGTAMPRSLWPTGAVLFEYAHQPIRLLERGVGPYASTVPQMLTAHVLLGAGITRWLALSLAVPLVLSQGFDERTPESDVPAIPSRAGMGDLRLIAKLRIIDNERGGFGLALAPQFVFPTGSAASFRGEDTVGIEPRLVLDYRLRRGLVLALNLGLFARTYNQNLDFGTTRVPSRITYGLGALLPLPKGFGVGAELSGALGLSALDGGAYYAPAELGVLGSWAHRSGLGVVLGVVPGLSATVGSPALRFFLGLGYHPAPRPVDPNAKPEVRVIREVRVVRVPAAGAGADGAAGAAPGQRPVVLDSDGDGLQDVADRCPFLPGLIDNGGCPMAAADRDHDGVPDGVDRCPMVPGPAQSGGCPEAGRVDSDQDGLDDKVDRCPTEPGPADNGGCPRKDGGRAQRPAPPPAPEPEPCVTQSGEPCAPIEVTQFMIRLRAPIRFRPGRTAPEAESAAVIAAIAKAVQADKGIKQVRLVVPAGGDRRAKQLAKQRMWSLNAMLMDAGLGKKQIQLVPSVVPGQQEITEVYLKRGKGKRDRKDE